MARYAFAVVLASLVLLSGCNDDRDEGPAPMSSTAPVTARPEALSAAADEIRGNRAADAQVRLEAWLKENAKDTYTAEALYLLGQSQAAQGQHEAGKKTLDEAIDRAEDRTLKALAMLGRADCNMAMGKFQLASRQYHWLENMYRDVKAIPQDEVLFKCGLANKKAGFDETADYWFKQVIECYATGPYAEKARQHHTKYSPAAGEPRVYTLQVDTYSTQKKAEEEASILREKNYRDVQVIESSRSGHKVWEVHVGKFGTKNDAALAQTEAELAGLPTTIRPATIEPLK
ncbi:MAG TPA: SPOR domain-containing protein [Planctomycetota bacterium]|nr:SPOR domain-containing protein [Planctomycetota bacterium]